MENITVQNVLEATKGTLLCGNPDTELLDICIDSRAVKSGDLFVPIIGEKVDAHRFINDALKLGAASLTSKREPELLQSGKPVILVEDTLLAMQELARYLRARLTCKVVGVTGSVGKTTTRELIATALATAKKGYQTEKNYNSQVGLPIAVSHIASDDEYAVLEMGMSEQGQIEILSSIGKPSVCVVTTIGTAHIEFLKTQENIRQEKLSIISHMDADGILFLNGDDPMLWELRGKLPCRTIYYGLSGDCDYRAEDITLSGGKSCFTCVHGTEQVSVCLNAFGKHNIVNSLAAIGVADALGIPMEQAVENFPAFTGQRQKLIQREGSFMILDDTYNASTTSMRASLDVLEELPCKGKRYAVLGDMFELGEKGEQYHREVGAYAATKQIAEVWCVGELSAYMKDEIDRADTPVQAYHFMDKDEAALSLMSRLGPDDLVLVKASNGMNFAALVQILESA